MQHFWPLPRLALWYCRETGGFISSDGEKGEINLSYHFHLLSGQDRVIWCVLMTMTVYCHFVQERGDQTQV